MPHPNGARAGTIGAASAKTGIKIPTIRYYEQIGLLPAPPRSDGNRRTYGPEAIDRLSFIRHARDLGFEIDAIRALLALRDDPCQSCRDVDGIAQRHLDDVKRRIAALAVLQKELEHMIEGCGQGHVADCRVLRVLSDHRHCLTEHDRQDRM
jgi:DNA-binding transcriptional MerR regulator